MAQPPRDGFQNFMSNPAFNMNPNQPPPQQQQPIMNYNNNSNNNMDPNFFYQQQQQFLQQHQQRPSPQQLQHLNYLRAQQQQQQQQQFGSNNNGFQGNYPSPQQQQQQISPQQQQMSPMLMNNTANTSPIRQNNNISPNVMYQNHLLQQQQQQIRPQQQQQFIPNYGRPPAPQGYPQLTQQAMNQMSPQQVQMYQQQMQRQQQLRQQQQLLQQQQPQQQAQLQPNQHLLMQQQQIQMQQHLQYQQMMQQRHHQHIQMQQHHHQLAPQPVRPKRPTRNATKKKKYDESSEEEEEEEEDLDLDSEDEASADSEFDDSDEGRKPSKKKQAKEIAESEEPVVIPMGTQVFERILDYRKQNGRQELLIKYKNTSFLHVEWVPLTQIENEHLGKHRVKKFLQKYHADGDKGEDFKEYLKMDRVIDDGELEDPQTGETRVYYLVKWNGSFYDAATWETEEDVRRCDSLLLDQFLSRKVIPQEKLEPVPPRPDVSRFAHYATSPAFKYNNSLRPYQLEGLNWLRYCYYSFRSCILADEMGLGKTVQSVALLNDMYNNLHIRGPFLIIAPLSTIPHWTRAFSAWTDLNVIDFRGSTMARNLIVETEFHYQDAEGNTIPNKFKFDVLITTYEMASAGAMTLKDIPWRCGVFDEAHRLKNKNSKVLEILRTFYMDHKLLLTGTPLQNNLGELYSLLQFMQPDIYNDEAYFFSEYGSLKSAHEVEKLQALLQPIMLRRFKEDVEKTIPVKEETVIEVELTNPQKKWYRAILEKNFSFLKKGAKTNKEMPHLRNIMMQLRKCCIHPYLLEGAEDVIVSECNATQPQEQFNCLVQSSGKLVLIDKLLRKLIQGNHKVLIFSQFTSCLDILADYLRGRSYAYERIDGSVPGDQRQAAIDRFSTLPIEESFVFLLCTRAGGVGINLTAADTCIIFDSDWNPQNDLQAQARCHRIGQTKPVQIYRLICANTYEKDMFDRAGMKLGLDKAVMGTHDDGNANKTTELNRKEIEDLLKKGAYGAMLDDEASAKFCEEDIDQILERRTTVIKHEGNEKGSVFSKATFSAAVDDDNVGVDLDDPDFWEKWAAKAQIETSDLPDENTLIVHLPRKRRQVQRFGSRTHDGSYSSNDNADDSDAAYEEEEVETPKGGRTTRGGGRSDQARPWTLSEKTKYERKLMIYGYGSWDLMVAHFPRRSEKDLKAVTRALMRKTLPILENVKKATEEDRKLVSDIKNILINDARDEVKKNDNIPYIGATKKQIAEFKSFLAPEDYVDHIERKGRNFLLRIQMLHLIRDKIVPEDWEEAKQLEMPKVTGSPPAKWWGENEDRCLLLGICKHGYQQYLAMRNDPEFVFYGRKYDDSQSGILEDDDAAPSTEPKEASNEPIVAKKTFVKRGDDSDYEDDKDKDYSDDEDNYVWPSKADIGMRLRRIIAAFLRERANSTRKRKLQEKVEKKENDRQTRQKQKESRAAQRQRARASETSNRWTKKNKMDFIKTLMSFGVEREDDDFNWTRFKEIAALDKKTDDALNAHYRETYVACEEAVKRFVSEGGSNAVPNETPVSSPKMQSRESSVEPNEAKDDLDNVVPYDKARRALKRIEQMNTIREKVLVHEDLNNLLLKARKTSGLPTWWEVPKHDKALLEAICKHGIGRTDLILQDIDLPFYHVKQSLVGDNDFEESEHDHDEEDGSKFVWPRDLVVARRIDSLCDLVLNPKPLSIRQTRKRKAPSGTGPGKKRTKNADMMEEDEEEYEDEEEGEEADDEMVPSPVVVATDGHMSISQFIEKPVAFAPVATLEPVVESKEVPIQTHQEALAQEVVVEKKEELVAAETIVKEDTEMKDVIEESVIQKEEQIKEEVQLPQYMMVTEPVVSSEPTNQE